MTTSFPTALDAFTNPGPDDDLDASSVPHDVQHANANDAIEALQAKVGIDGSTDPTSLEHRLTTAESTLTTHTQASDPHPQYLTLTEADAAYEAKNANIQAHIGNTGNPHAVTKAQVGLGNVDNTSDAAKPISTATQAALDAKAGTGHDHDLAYEAKNANIQSHIAITAGNPHGVTKGDLGLGSVENKSSATIRGELTSGNVTTALGFSPEPVDANIVRKNVPATMTAQMAPMQGTLDSGASANIDWDCNVTGQVVYCGLAAARTLNAPTNVKPGALYLLRLAPLGAYSLSFASAYKFGSAGAPAQTMTFPKSDILSFLGASANTMIFLGIRKDAV